MTPEDVLQKIQYLNKYSRFLYEKGKRETWGQTVARTVDYLKKESGAALDDNTASDIFSAIFNKEISPSMRLIATAGKAADANQLGIYNCSFLPLSSIKDFYDLTILLGHGAGVGFSVEKRYVGEWEKVPVLTKTVYNFEVEDSIQGWAFSFFAQLSNALDGYRVNFNYDKIRPSGSPLMTRGGTASGPEPLREAHVAIEKILEKRQGLHLRSVDLFDIACYIAGAIVSGGVRRSAMIAIFDHSDTDMMTSKSGEWYIDNLQRQYANISFVVDRRMTLEEWRGYVTMMDLNKSGEPGIWSRYAIKRHLPERRQYVDTMGPNPLEYAALESNF